MKANTVHQRHQVGGNQVGGNQQGNQVGPNLQGRSVTVTPSLRTQVGQILASPEAQLIASGIGTICLTPFQSPYPCEESYPNISLVRGKTCYWLDPSEQPLVTTCFIAITTWTVISLYRLFVSPIDTKK